MSVSIEPPSRHQRGRRACAHLGEGEAGDHHRADEILPRRVGIAALEFVLVGKGDGVDDEIDACPIASSSVVEHRVDRGAVLDIAGQDELASRAICGERLDAPAEGLALIGEGQLRALRAQARLAMPQAIE